MSEKSLFKSGSTVPQPAQSRSTDPNPLAGQVTCSVPFRECNVECLLLATVGSPLSDDHPSRYS